MMFYDAVMRDQYSASPQIGTLSCLYYDYIVVYAIVLEHYSTA